MREPLVNSPMTAPPGELRTSSGLPLVDTCAKESGLPTSSVGTSLYRTQSLEIQVPLLRSAQVPLLRPDISMRLPLTNVPITKPPGALRTFSGVPLVLTKAVVRSPPSDISGEALGVPVNDSQLLEIQELSMRSDHSPLVRPVRSTRAPLGRLPITAPPGELRTFSGVPLVLTNAVSEASPTGV